jgi:lysophospholipase L1-like esterase
MSRALITAAAAAVASVWPTGAAERREPTASRHLVAEVRRDEKRHFVIVAEGDSLSIFWSGNYTGIFAVTHPNIVFHGQAVGGSRISAASGNGLVQRMPLDIGLKPDLITILIGANDLGDGTYASAEAWLNALWKYVAAIKATGVRVAVGTVLPICLPSAPQYQKTHAARRAVVNEQIRQAVGSKIDAIIDFAADSEIGPDSAACDRRLYKDGLHPTDGNRNYEGGEGIMARIYSGSIAAFVTTRVTH